MLGGTELDVDTGDAVLRCHLWGQGPTVIAVHGFPDCPRTYREQLGPLVDAGHRVVLPWLRGYAPSSVARSGRYHAAALGSDLVSLAEQLGNGSPVRLIGHDWGAIAAYAACALAPERFSHLVTLAIPHLKVALPRFAKPTQLGRSAYIGLFQLRGVAEVALVADDMALVDWLWRRWSPGYECPAEELVHIKAAIRPRIGEVLAFYRELLSPSAARASGPLLLRTTRVPSLVLHGQDDGCVGAELAMGLQRAFAHGVELHVVEGAGHFLHLERPIEVNQRILRFFAA